MTKDLPNKPFLTKDFSLPGGGIDFLGLRWVNLNILGKDLVPELNNRTADMGMFCIGAWIPWKFKQLCSGKKEYTEKNYRIFKEKVEVALSLTFRDESHISRPQGTVRDRVGIAQTAALPGPLNFDTAKRKDQNSLFAAAIYGPAIRSLGFIAAYHSQDETGKRPLNIAVPGTDPDVLAIIKTVDNTLSKARNYSALASLASPSFVWKNIATLGEAGLDPARFRATSYGTLKQAFARRLLPTEPTALGYARTLTTRLILVSLQHRPDSTLWDLRQAWYTGLFPNGKKLRIADTELIRHKDRWAAFLARQYQRRAIELFLWCFEDALKRECSSVDEIVDHWIRRTPKREGGLHDTFRDVLDDTAGDLLANDELSTSRAWNAKVHSDHDQFETVEEPMDDLAVCHGLRMFAGWYWRMLARQDNENTKDLMSLGGSDRIGMSWFLQWLRDRSDRPLRSLLRDIFSDIVFAQHMRIALSRFDGSAQRLRFLLGDNGIEPTVSARDQMGTFDLPWMPDRLDTLSALLCDCDILQMKDDKLTSGPRAAQWEQR